jgi:hypothetical protein
VPQILLYCANVRTLPVLKGSQIFSRGVNNPFATDRVNQACDPFPFLNASAFPTVESRSECYPFDYPQQVFVWLAHGVGGHQPITRMAFVTDCKTLGQSFRYSDDPLFRVLDLPPELLAFAVYVNFPILEINIHPFDVCPSPFAEPNAKEKSQHVSFILVCELEQPL